MSSRSRSAPRKYTTWPEEALGRKGTELIIPAEAKPEVGEIWQQILDRGLKEGRTPRPRAVAGYRYRPVT